jgi:hypothetical protein
MRPLSDIVIYFHKNYGYFRHASTYSLRRFSVMDLDMLVGLGILNRRYDPNFGTKFYRLARYRTSPKGTKMIYSQRIQAMKDWHKRRRAA